MSRITQKMGYVSPLGEKSFFEEDEKQNKELEFFNDLDKFSLRLIVKFVKDESNYIKFVSRPKEPGIAFLYVSLTKKKAHIRKKKRVKRLSESGIRFNDIENIHGLTLSKNLVQLIEKDKQYASSIIKKILKRIEVESDIYDNIKLFLLEKLFSFVHANPSTKEYKVPNNFENIFDFLSLCIQLGVNELSEIATYVSEEILKKLAENIRDSQLGEERWNPNVATIRYDENTSEKATYNPLFPVLSKVEKGIAETTENLQLSENEKSQYKTTNHKEHESLIDNIISYVFDFYNTIIDWFAKLIMDALGALFDLADHTLKRFNAFAVGFINGILSFAANIIDAIAFIISLINSESRKLIIESIKNFINTVDWALIKKIIKDKFKKIFAFTEGDEPYKNAYEFGTFIPEILELVLDIIGLAKGTAKLAKSAFELIKRMPEAYRQINKALRELYLDLSLIRINKKLLSDLRDKGIKVGIKRKFAHSLGANGGKLYDGKWIIVKYDDLELKRFTKEIDADDYLKKLNNDQKFFDEEIKLKLKNLRRKLRKTEEFKDINDWFIRNRANFMDGDILDIDIVKSSWKNNTNIIKKELKEKGLNYLREIKNSTRFLENQNIVKAKLELEIDGKVIEYEYIEHSGKGAKLKKSKGHPIGRNVNENEFWDTEFEKPRKDDSESKVIELMNEDIANALINNKKVTVKKVTMQSTYDPCNVCKKELLLFQERFKTTFEIERPFFKENGTIKVVKNNDDFKKLNL